jgi:hypothetical protein
MHTQKKLLGVSECLEDEAEKSVCSRSTAGIRLKRGKVNG